MFKLANYSINHVADGADNYVHSPSLDIIKTRSMWPTSTGKRVIVAIIDTGVARTHPALTDKIVNGYNFVPGEAPERYDDENCHGTHVAGIISLIAPDAKLLILRALDKNGSCIVSTLVISVYYAIDYKDKDGRGVDIINMSLGCPEDSPALRQAIEMAVGKGIMVCCAAGNEGDGNSNTQEFSYPAMYPDVVSVGAVDFSSQVAKFSNTNNEVDLAAPGDHIWSTLPDGKYGALSGTSMACPHVAGMAALYIEKYGRRFNKRPSEEELYLILKVMAKDIGALGIEADTGAGLVSAWL